MPENRLAEAVHLSEAALALLRRLVSTRMTASRSRPKPSRSTASWPRPGSYIRYPGCLEGRRRTSVSPTTAGCTATKFLLAKPDRSEQSPRTIANRQFCLGCELNRPLVSADAPLHVLVHDGGVNARAKPGLPPGLRGGRCQVRHLFGIQCSRIDVESSVRYNPTRVSLEGIESTPPKAVAMVRRADPLIGDSQFFHPPSDEGFAHIPPFDGRFDGVQCGVGRIGRKTSIRGERADDAETFV